MSRGSSRPENNWQRAQDYWIYLPTNPTPSDFLPPFTRSLNPRGRITREPWWLFEERSTGGPNYGLASFPTAPSPRPLRLLLIDDYDTYPRAQSPIPTTLPRYHQPWYNNNQVYEEEEQPSRLSADEQNQAVNKLRKQFYNPHMSNIIKRISTKSNSNGGSSFKQQEDDDGKRCAVCLDDFESKQFVMTTPCNHMFHEECIVPWVKSQGKCPVCRYVIVEKNQNGTQQSSTTNNGSGFRRGGIQRDIVSVMRSFN